MTKTFDVVGKKKYFYIFSVAVIVITLLLAAILGVNVDIEFKGGTIITYSYTGDIDGDAIASTAEDITGLACSISYGESVSDGSETISLSFAESTGMDTEIQSELTDTLEETYSSNSLTLYSSQDVNPSTGSGFFGKCMVAVAFSMVVMIVYIGFRFRKIGGWVAGICAVVALAHDMFFVFACTTILRFDIDSNFIAVLLTILGYSVNATIIIYDRIRENRNLYGTEKSLDELVNMSVSQSFGRSVHTTVTTVIAVASICVVALFANVDSIVSFAFPLLVGLLSGVYSSNCIAPTLWTTWQGHIDRKNAEKALTENVNTAVPSKKKSSKKKKK
ncbi:MAG: protein translocase subunit SecF [Oscillospiraceae bacterium]|nr:protein translocase subunit SecF [Oscillospiraceae bacterium]